MYKRTDNVYMDVHLMLNRAWVYRIEKYKSQGKKLLITAANAKVHSVYGITSIHHIYI